jgi:hypothetical protein
MPNPYANPFGHSYGAAYNTPSGNTPTGTPPGGPGPIDENFYYNQDPLAGWYHWLYGLNPSNWGTTPGARYAQQQYGRYQGQYEAEAAKDPMLGWYDWLNKQQNRPDQEFEMQSPEQRGDYSSRTLAPRARWAVG